MKNKPETSPTLFGFGHLTEVLLPQAKHEKPPAPAFSDLWYMADHAVAELMETFPEQYWAHAAKSARLPLLFPRKRHEQKKFIALLEGRNIIRKGRGRTREQDAPMNREVEAAYEKVQEEHSHLRLRKKRGDKLNPAQKEVEALPAFRTKTASETWIRWLVTAFLDTHDEKPEECPELLSLVKQRVDSSKSSPTPRDYRNEIKRDFRKAAKRFAKELTALLGD